MIGGGQAAPVSDSGIPVELIPEAVTALRKAQEEEKGAYEALAKYFPEYGYLVMETDTARYLQLAAQAGLTVTRILIMQCIQEPCQPWGVSVDTYSLDYGFPLASVSLGDYASRTKAIKVAKLLAEGGGWEFPAKDDWSEFDCGGSEIHIPIHARPRVGAAVDGDS